MSATLQKNLNNVLDTIEFVGSYTANKLYQTKRHHLIAPAVMPYSSVLNPINLFSVPDFDIFNDLRVALVRDGVLPLCHFFHMYPSPPKKFKTTFLIHESLYPFVPEEWHAQVALYNHGINTLNSTYSEKKTGLILCATLDQFSFDKDYFTKRLSLAKETFDQLQLKTIKVLFHNRKNPILHPLEDISRFFSQRLQELFTTFSPEQVSFMTKKKIHNTSKLHHLIPIDFDDCSPFHVDSFVNQVIWSKNCLPIDLPVRKIGPSKEHFIRTSNHHGVILSSNPPMNYQNLSLELNEMKKIFKAKKIKDISCFEDYQPLLNKHLCSYLREASLPYRSQPSPYLVEL